MVFCLLGLKKKFKRQVVLELGIQALLRNDIRQAYKECVNKGYCSLDDMENIQDMYDSYHALGGNGSVTRLIEKLKKMDTEKSIKRKGVLKMSEVTEVKTLEPTEWLEGESVITERELTFLQRLARLLSVKSLVTVTLTGVFAYLSIVGKVEPQQFMTIFTVIISFYFGVQSTKGKE